MRRFLTAPIRVLARPRLLAIAMAILSSCATVIHQLPESTIELTAMRAVLAPYRLGFVAVDSVFALPDQAPPEMTSRVRPASRHRGLADSVRSVQIPSGTDTLRVRASEPLIQGDTATISVTVDGRLGRGGNRRYYETVTLVLQRDGSRWRIRSRTQLGVS